MSKNNQNPRVNSGSINLYVRALFFLVISSTCGRATSTLTPVATPTPVQTFPLTASSNGRYLQTPAGQPFLVVADSAWNLMSLSPANQAFYMDTRKAEGFNTLLVAGVTGPYVGTAFTQIRAATLHLEITRISRQLTRPILITWLPWSHLRSPKTCFFFFIRWRQDTGYLIAQTTPPLLDPWLLME